MSKWNHRVWKIVHNEGKEYEEAIYEVRETYYNKAGEICGCTEEATQAYGYSQIGLVETLQRMLRIASDENADILMYNNFIFAEWD